MADINVRQTSSYKAENRTWVYADPGQWTRASGTLDMSLFTKAAHYPDGFIPSGTVIAKVTSGASEGLYGPYDKDATDGRSVPAGFLWDSDQVTGADRSVIPFQFRGVILESKLPATSGLDDDAKTALAAKFDFF